MKARKKQPVITRRVLLDAAGSCFSAKGYSATGISAIVEASGLTRGALFHHFADKRELALAWIEEELQPQLASRWIDPLEDIGSLSALSDFWQEACGRLAGEDPCAILVAMAAELGGRDPRLGEALDGLFRRWRESLARCLQQGQEQAWIHRSIRPSTEAGILISMLAGLSVTIRCGPSGGQDQWPASLKAYLETLRPV